MFYGSEGTSAAFDKLSDKSVCVILLIPDKIELVCSASEIQHCDLFTCYTVLDYFLISNTVFSIACYI